MAVALLGYFTTMVTALIGFMLLLNGVLSSSYFPEAHRRPHPMPAIAETAVPDRQPARSTQMASTETPKPAAASKSKHVKVAARDQKRKQGFAARQQDNREYVMGPRYAQGGQDGQGGMGMRYAQGGAWQPEGMFGQFGTGRF